MAHILKDSLETSRLVALTPRLQLHGIRHELQIEDRAYALTGLKAPEQRSDWMAVILRIEIAGNLYLRPMRLDRPENRQTIAQEAGDKLGVWSQILLDDLETLHDAALSYLLDRTSPEAMSSHGRGQQ